MEISSFDDAPLPCVDALYIGGGFPETHLERLSANSRFRESVKSVVEAGMPVYAECGGLMFLCRGIHHQEKIYPMVGVFPFEIVLGPKPQGHGYTVMECVNPNPFFEKGSIIRGHEFHYSRIAAPIDANFPFAFKLLKGHGIQAGWDGVCYKNTFAGYSHIHAVGNEEWAEAMVLAAEKFQRDRIGMSADSGVDAERALPESYGYFSV